MGGTSGLVVSPLTNREFIESVFVYRYYLFRRIVYE